MTRGHKLLTKALAAKLPPLYSTEKTPTAEKIAIIKFFDCCSQWTWYGVEYDPKDRVFFGWVIGHVKEWGYFSLDELEETTNKLKLPLERDLWFKPTKMKDIPGYEE